MFLYIIRKHCQLLFLSKSKHKVSPNVKETSPAREAIVDNGMRSSVALNAATSSGLLSTLLTASVNEIKHVAETMNQVSVACVNELNIVVIRVIKI